MAAIACPAPRSAQPLPLHLRRLAAALLLLAIVGALTASIALATRHDTGLPAGRGEVARLDGAPAVQVSASVHVVQPGDTLWSIARAVQAHGDPRPLVAALSAQTRGRPLEPGERIAIPTP